MNENINLCEILKGHEGETFYCCLTGRNVTLHQMYGNIIEIKKENDITIKLYSNGGFLETGECQLFPSKDHRDWVKWDKENNKVPKTWSELYKKEMADSYDLGKNGEFHVTNERFNSNEYLDDVTPIEKLALALLKIHQLIEVGYGGNVTDKEWKDTTKLKWYFIPYINSTFKIVCSQNYDKKRHIAFHTEEQAKEFLSKPENVQLLKDYFMFN